MGQHTAKSSGDTRKTSNTTAS